MIHLLGTTDKLQLITSSAANIDVVASYFDAVASGLTSPIGGRQATTIAAAATTDIVATPAASAIRNVKSLFIRNRHASLSCDVTVIVNISATLYELHKATLRASEALEYIEGLGFFTLAPGRLDRRLRVASDVVNATTAFADVTGLTCPVQNGKTYNFEAHLIHVNNATTTGSQFGINGPSLSNVHVATIDTVTPSVTGAALSAGAATAVNTAATAQTTGSTTNRLGILSGVFTAGADGTFAIRCASEVAVAAGLTVRAGSWCHLWEMTG